MIGTNALRGGNWIERLNSDQITITSSDAPRAAASGQNTAPCCACAIRIRNPPNPAPDKSASRMLVARPARGVSEDPVREMNHTPARAKINPSSTSGTGNPCVSAPAITGSAAETTPDTGATVPICPIDMAR